MTVILSKLHVEINQKFYILRFEALRHPLRVAVLATRTDLRTPGDRIPGRVSPLDVGVARHQAGPRFRYLLKIASTIFFPVAFGDAKNK